MKMKVVFGSQVREHLIPKQPLMTVDDFLQKIELDQVFGLVQCSVRVPEHQKSRFSQFSPIFKQAEVSLLDVGPHMRDICIRHGELKKPRRTLISSYYGEILLLTTSQIQWYLKNGKLYISKLEWCSI